jgi:two-component system response regulator YesN
MYSYIVVDDEHIIRKGTIAKLQEMKGQAACAGEAEDGEAALALIERCSPDIIITDMNMTVMDGMQLLPLVMERYPNIQLIIISGYKDFEYVKQAIFAHAADYLLKPFSREDLMAAMAKAIAALAARRMPAQGILSSSEEIELAHYDYDLHTLKSNLMSESSPAGELTSNRLRLVNQNHEFFVIATASAQPQETALYDEFLQSGGFGDLALHLSYPNSKLVEVLVLFLPENAALPHQWLCKQVAASLGSLLEAEGRGGEVLMGVSDPYSDLHQLRSAFKQAIQALNEHIPGDGARVYSAGEGGRGSAHFEWEKEQELLFRLEAGMEDKVAFLISALFDEWSSSSIYRMADMKSYCFHLCDYARSVLRSYYEPRESQSTSRSAQLVWETIFSLEGLREYYTRFFVNISTALGSKSVYAGGDTVEKIKTYVQRNYMNKLSIELLADLFYLNRSYCSSLFKMQAGTKFVDYVNSVRLEKAKELLRRSDMKMYQVAKAVGYDNVKYFFRVFKAMVGCTPEKYRHGSCS